MITAQRTNCLTTQHEQGEALKHLASLRGVRRFSAAPVLSARVPSRYLAARASRRQRGSVARSARREAPGAIHHVVAQGNNRQATVVDDCDRAMLVRGVGEAACRYSWCLHAYCLMTTHLHLVVQTREPNLGRGVGRLLGSYARWFNRRHGREGHLFGTPFFSRLLETDEHVLAATLYVLVNPVRARLCHHPSEWTWGSYRDAVELRPTLVPTAPLLERLAPDPRVARARAELVDEQVARIAEEGRRETVRAGR